LYGVADVKASKLEKGQRGGAGKMNLNRQNVRVCDKKVKRNIKAFKEK